MTSKPEFFAEDGSVELPESTDDTKCFELVWDGRKITTYEDAPIDFIYKCQNTLKSHSPVINVISTETIEGITEPGFPIIVPSISDRYSTTKIPQMWGDGIYTTGEVDLILAELDMLVENVDIHSQGTTHYVKRLFEKIGGMSISGPLLEDFAAILNKRLTIALLKRAYTTNETSFYDAIKKYSEAKYSRNDRNHYDHRTYGLGAKVMLHPQSLALVPDIKNWGFSQEKSKPDNTKVCLNWDMPAPSHGMVEILIGNFSEFMSVLKPIQITIECRKESTVRRYIKAETQTLNGIWSDVSLGFVNAKIRLI